MKLRTLGVFAMLVLAPAAARAQGTWPCCQPLSQAVVNQMLPLLQAEAASSNSLNARLEQVAMMKSTYVARKNALMVARLDAATPSRLSALPFDDGSRATRQANVAVYRTNKARIDAALAHVNADPTCGLCVPGAAGAAGAAGATTIRR